MVFPLGMYAVAGHFLGLADGLPALTDIGDLAGWVALAAWTLTFLAMCGLVGAKARVARAFAHRSERAEVGHGTGPSARCAIIPAAAVGTVLRSPNRRLRELARRQRRYPSPSTSGRRREVLRAAGGAGHRVAVLHRPPSSMRPGSDVQPSTAP